MHYVLQILFIDTNNVTKCVALLNDLHLIVSMDTRKLEFRGDSDLVVSQVTRDFEAKDPRMITYRDTVRRLGNNFDGLMFQYIKRADNAAADTIAKMARSGIQCHVVSSLRSDINLPSSW